jgi:hypothetical protein
MGHSDRVIILVLQQRWAITIDLFFLNAEKFIEEPSNTNFKVYFDRTWTLVMNAIST